jgi:hypothetical protein
MRTLMSPGREIFSQTKPPVPAGLKAEVYYFHPNDRCPIDQSIEENTIKVIYNTYSKEIKDGTFRFAVINTDDKSQTKTISRFEINAQALFVVKWTNGKEVKTDLTHFAFDNGLSNPDRFRIGLKDEIDKALKP